jgi:hypothetical protein
MYMHRVISQAIRSAERKGFDLCEWWDDYMSTPFPDTLEGAVAELMEHHNWEKLLFAPAFARSLWGDDDSENDHADPEWSMYLSSMAAAEPAQRIRFFEMYLRQAV